MIKSKITGGDTTLLFTAKILNKYDVKYYRCNQTGFIQTEDAYWLEESYSSAITKLDIGLPYRNNRLQGLVTKVLGGGNFNTTGKFLDYAGGYGLFTRLMRDQGLDFYHTDKYCQNIFAEYFDLSDLPNGARFEAATAFEVFEHLPEPLPEIEHILSYSDDLLFTTELQPATPLNSVDDWWYFIPETGQHLALYTAESLKFIADKLGYNFHTDGTSLHLFTKKQLAKNPLVFDKDPFLVRKARKLIRKFEAKQYGRRESLLMTDWQYIKSQLKD